MKSLPRGKGLLNGSSQDKVLEGHSSSVGPRVTSPEVQISSTLLFLLFCVLLLLIIIADVINMVREI